MCIFDEKLSEETLATLQNFEFAVRSDFNILVSNSFNMVT